jgi:hypothetical protein
MRKLEDIPKKPAFKVPEGYFEQLPTKIQSRMVEKQRSSVSSAVNFLRYALPVVALVVFGILWLRPEARIEDQLAEIDADQIAIYLASTDRADLEEMPDPDEWTSSELDQLEEEVYSNMEYTNEDLLEELDLENL